MTYEVIFYFDEGTESAIIDWMEKLCGGGTNNHVLEGNVKPYLSLALFEKEDGENLPEIFQEFASIIKACSVQFSSIGVFPPAELFLVPVDTEELTEAQTLIHLMLAKSVKDFDRFHLPNRWTPRVSLGVGENRDEVMEAFGILLDEFHDLEGNIIQTALIKNDPFEEVMTVELK